MSVKSPWCQVVKTVRFTFDLLFLLVFTGAIAGGWTFFTCFISTDWFDQFTAGFATCFCAVIMVALSSAILARCDRHVDYDCPFPVRVRVALMSTLLWCGAGALAIDYSASRYTPPLVNLDPAYRTAMAHNEASVRAMRFGDIAMMKSGELRVKTLAPLGVEPGAWPYNNCPAGSYQVADIKATAGELREVIRYENPRWEPLVERYLRTEKCIVRAP